MYIVDIDVGGTLTDGIFSGGDEPLHVKVDTTPHDLTVCFFDCLDEGARQLGFDQLVDFLDDVDLIRWSTTITSNVLAERRGPKIGLIVTSGHEGDLYGGAENPVLGYMVEQSNIVGIGPAAGREDVLEAVRHLLEKGVRRICVSLHGAFEDPAAEIRIRDFIDEQYPDHFLGSVPVLLGSDIHKSPDDMTRTNCALLNAYTHSSLATTLFKAEDRLLFDEGYVRAFMINHINGGVATIAKTKAMDTIESGPVLGIYGSGYFATTYGLDRVIALDVGGTTAKVGLLIDGEPYSSKETDLFGVPLKITLPYLRSIALGGGSVVRADTASGEKTVTLGPDSVGSFPGPACYGLGNETPTLTDALVAGGVIDPDYFLGGTKKLDRKLARNAIEQGVGLPLDVTVEAACATVLDIAFDMVAEKIREALDDHGGAAEDFALFAYGGNGGLFACAVAGRLGIADVYVFSAGPVFSAFGSSMSDLSHVYEQSLATSLAPESRLARLKELFAEMKARALGDIRGEGFSGEHATMWVELDVSDGNQQGSIRSPYEDFEGLESDRQLLELPCSISLAGAKDVDISVIRLGVKEEIPKPRIVEKKSQGGGSGAVEAGTRAIVMGGDEGEAVIHKLDALPAGAVLTGRAIIETSKTTCFLPQGWTMTVDGFGNGHIRHASPDNHS